MSKADDHDACNVLELSDLVFVFARQLLLLLLFVAQLALQRADLRLRVLGRLVGLCQLTWFYANNQIPTLKVSISYDKPSSKTINNEQCDLGIFSESQVEKRKHQRKE